MYEAFCYKFWHMRPSIRCFCCRALSTTQDVITRWIIEINSYTHFQVFVFALASERAGGQLGLLSCQGVSPSAYFLGTYTW